MFTEVVSTGIYFRIGCVSLLGAFFKVLESVVKELDKTEANDVLINHHSYLIRPPSLSIASTFDLFSEPFSKHTMCFIEVVDKLAFIDLIYMLKTNKGFDWYLGVNRDGFACGHRQHTLNEYVSITTFGGASPANDPYLSLTVAFTAAG